MMAQYYIMFETMKSMAELSNDATIEQELSMVCGAHEFNDMRLRVGEKRALNQANSQIRFPLKGRIKTTDMKVNVLLQVASVMMTYLTMNRLH